jgi:hypothetical protein
VSGCDCGCHKTFKRGDRVVARDWRGQPLGRGKVIWSQPKEFYGPYMKVRLDSGALVTVPMHTSNRLLPKK